MVELKNSMSANDAWTSIIERYDILSKVAQNGIFHIKASEIKEYKEPRLMAKWDSTTSLPKVLRDNKLNILPNSRSSYVLGDFCLYQDIPELEERVEKMTHIELPAYETLDVNNITSEANAINVLLLSGILDDFLETGENVATFNGRMGTGEFGFSVNTHSHGKQQIHVANAQCEIDGGFENDTSVVIMEAKNVIHKDFNIRQLYYPYRLWRARVKKPIRLVFSIYSNMIYRLFEYRFADIEDLSSIELVRTKNYSLQDTEITMADLEIVRKQTIVRTEDKQTGRGRDTIPFIQADSMDRIINLLENLYNNPMTSKEIAVLMDFTSRQSNYYVSAGKYLGLFEDGKNGENRKATVLSSLGNKVFKMNYKKRQLKIVGLMFEHRIFAECFDRIVESGELPSLSFVMDRMRAFDVCNESCVERRAQSVLGWLRWMLYLTQIN